MPIALPMAFKRLMQNASNLKDICEPKIEPTFVLKLL